MINDYVKALILFHLQRVKEEARSASEFSYKTTDLPFIWSLVKYEIILQEQIR